MNDEQLGKLIRVALSCRGFVSIELYEDQYHANVGDWHVDSGVGDTPEEALAAALEWEN